MSSPFSDEALKAQVEKLQDLPPEQGGIGVVAKEGGDVGVEISGNKQLGTRGWFVQGEASWMRRAGYSVAAFFGWKGKS